VLFRASNIMKSGTRKTSPGNIESSVSFHNTPNPSKAPSLEVGELILRAITFSSVWTSASWLYSQMSSTARTWYGAASGLRYRKS
jgi:hypothetical protein